MSFERVPEIAGGQEVPIDMQYCQFVHRGH
jgi:hypothetical protein